MPQIPIPLSEDNLEAGIHFWRSHKVHWPSDFHNGLYGDLVRWCADGLTQSWWDEIVPLLSAWKANRPRSAEYIRGRGSGLLASLNHAYEEVVKAVPSQHVEFAEIQWKTVRDLYHVAYSIKGVVSPMFASKLCHFILPTAFPVIDGDAVGLLFDSYQSYWTACRDAWAGCQVRDTLVEVLRRTIGSPPAPDYPWGPKITELCLIGSKATTSGGGSVGH